MSFIAHVCRVPGGYAARVIGDSARRVIAAATHLFETAEAALEWARAAQEACRRGLGLPVVPKPRNVPTASLARALGFRVPAMGARGHCTFDVRRSGYLFTSRKRADVATLRARIAGLE